MLTPAFARRRGMDGEGVDAVLEFADKCRVDHAVALEPALAAKRFRDDIDPEMSLTARPVPCMPCMLVDSSTTSTLWGVNAVVNFSVMTSRVAMAVRIARAMAGGQRPACAKSA